MPIETGKNMDKLDSFDPFAVPTVKQICDEFVSVKEEGVGSAGKLLFAPITVFSELSK